MRRFRRSRPDRAQAAQRRRTSITVEMPSGALWLQAVATAVLALLTGALIGINVQYLQQMERMAAFQRGQQQPYVDYLDLELVPEGDGEGDGPALAVSNLSDAPVVVREVLVRIAPLERRSVRVSDLERTPWMPVAWAGRELPGGASSEPASLAPQSRTRLSSVPGLAEYDAFREALEKRTHADGIERRVRLTVELSVEENTPDASDVRRFVFDFVGDGAGLNSFRAIDSDEGGLDYMLDYETTRASIGGVELSKATVTPQLGGTTRVTGETDQADTVEALEHLSLGETYDLAVRAERPDGTPLYLSGEAEMLACELSPLDAAERTQYLCDLDRRANSGAP